MVIAHVVSLRGTCDRAQVGAVLVQDNHIISTGYNGSPRGLPHCDEIGHLMQSGHCVRTVHAEQNALIQAALHGVSTEGAILYVTHFPCLSCTKLLVNAKIAGIVFLHDYRIDPAAEEMLHQAQVGYHQAPFASCFAQSRFEQSLEFLLQSCQDT